MLVQVQGVIQQGAHIAVHREVELGIVPFDGRKEFIDTDFGVQLLSYLASECLDRTFTRLNLAARCLPIILPFAVAPLGGEDSIPFADDGGYDFYCLYNQKMVRLGLYST